LQFEVFNFSLPVAVIVAVLAAVSLCGGGSGGVVFPLAISGGGRRGPLSVWRRGVLGNGSQGGPPVGLVAAESLRRRRNEGLRGAGGVAGAAEARNEEPHQAKKKKVWVWNKFVVIINVREWVATISNLRVIQKWL